MKNSSIKILTILGLLAILALQSIWLYNTYIIIKEETIKKSNELFKDASTIELYKRVQNLRLINDSINNSIINIDIQDNTMGNSDIMANTVHISLQEIMDTLYNCPISLKNLDSIYCAKLSSANMPTNAICSIVDSLGNILVQDSTKTYIPSNGYSSLKTSIISISSDNSRGIQAIIINPYWSIFKQMGLLLIATALIMIIVAYCIIYQIKIINKQNRIGQMREDFSYAMVHDMKTPLSSIIMCANFLHSGRLDNKSEMKDKYFSIIEDESNHLLMLTNKLLTISKLENHKLEMVKTSIELKPLLNDLIEKFIAKTAKEIHFSTNLQISEIYGDEEFVKEAISNLIDNSIKYSENSVTIEITSKETEKYSLLSIRDNGIGISQKDLKTIFNKFERASATKRTKSGGAPGFGLGLNYVKQVMEAHNGKVIANSIKNEFSEFILYFPKEQKN